MIGSIALLCGLLILNVGSSNAFFVVQVQKNDNKNILTRVLSSDQQQSSLLRSSSPSQSSSILPSTSRRKDQQKQYYYERRNLLLLATPAASTTGSSSTSSSNDDNDDDSNNNSKPYKHGLAILTMPSTSLDKIANEAILQTILSKTWKLSVYLRCNNDVVGTDRSPSLSSLRRYVGEVYSTLWDFCSESTSLEDVVVYAQNLPNTAPEQWIHHLNDLDCICSHDTICGWTSKTDETYGRGTIFLQDDNNNNSKFAKGGLDEHVKAVNDDRLSRNLNPVIPLHVSHWPAGACSRFNDDHNVIFLDDDALEDEQINNIKKKTKQILSSSSNDDDDDEDEEIIENSNSSNGGYTAASFLGGARIPSKALFTSVAVGGTFDGMHYGHRKLLTLAISSVQPQTGKLLVGVTVDEMLKQKQYSEYIPTIQQRMDDVRKFLYRLAPGMKNRIKIVPIKDKFGPPGSLPSSDNTNTNNNNNNTDSNNELWTNDFDALVLSHETLQTGHELNVHRKEKLGLPPLVLLCTRRTEAIGMSSTTLRKMRSDRIFKQKIIKQQKQEQEEMK